MAQSNNAEDGEPLMDRSDYAEALNMYLASLDAPRDEEHRAKCHVGASACHLQLEQPQDALRHALQAIKLQPQNPAPRQSYAAALAHLGRWAEALVALVLDLEEPAATAADVLKTLADWANRHHQGEEAATDDPAKTLAAALTCPITGDLLILPTTTADGDSFTLGADASFPLPATHVNVRLQAILERLFPGHGAAATSLREVVMHLQGTSGLLEANSAVLADVQALLQQSEQHQPTALAAILRTLLQPDPTLRHAELQDATAQLPPSPRLQMLLARASMELHKVARAVQEVLGALLLLPQDVSIQDTATQALRAWVEACCGSPEPMQTSTEQPDAAAWSNRCAARAADLQVILDAAVSFAQTKPHTAVPVAHSELLLLCQQRLELADLECELCYDLLWRSIALPCGHMLCRSCVLRTLDHKPECPVCRADLADFLAARQFCEVKALAPIIRHVFPTEAARRARDEQAELEELEQNLPIFVCTPTAPGLTYPLRVFEPRYRLMMRRVLATDRREFGMCGATMDGYADYGTTLRILRHEPTADGCLHVECLGTRRFHILSRSVKDGYNVAQVEWLEDVPLTDNEQAALREGLHEFIGPSSIWQSLAPFQRLQISLHFGEPPEDPVAAIYWVGAWVLRGELDILLRENHPIRRLEILQSSWREQHDAPL